MAHGNAAKGSGCLGELVISVAIAFAAATASAQNLLWNGSFENGSPESSANGCCEVLAGLPAGDRSLQGWTLGAAGVEWRGRGEECSFGPAEGQRWIRLGQGTAGGWILQAAAVEPSLRYALRFRRWVEAPAGVTVPVKVSAPGFNAIFYLIADADACDSEIAASTSIEFDALTESATVRLEYFGGPADRHVLIDRLELVRADDCDGNGLVDAFELLDGLAGDRDGDGVINPCDCLCDLDNDGLVGGTDLMMVVGTWGFADPLADLDGDGTVASGDLAMVLGNWGACR